MSTNTGMNELSNPLEKTITSLGNAFFAIVFVQNSKKTTSKYEEHVISFINFFQQNSLLVGNEWFDCVRKHKEIFFKNYHLFDNLSRQTLPCKLMKSLIRAISYLDTFLKERNVDYKTVSFKEMVVPDNNFRYHLDTLIKSYYHMTLYILMKKKGGCYEEKAANNLDLAIRLYNDTMNTDNV